MNHQEVMMNKVWIKQKLAGDSLNILVAEDNIMIQEYIGDLLESAGCRYKMAENGEKALKALEKEHFDLILMDLQMPVMDGFEATTRIRAMENQSGPHIPIVAITGYFLINGCQQCLKAGMDDYLVKPFTGMQLFKTIERLTQTKLRLNLG